MQPLLAPKQTPPPHPPHSPCWRQGILPFTLFPNLMEAAGTSCQPEWAQVFILVVRAHNSLRPLLHVASPVQRGEGGCQHAAQCAPASLVCVGSSQVQTILLVIPSCVCLVAPFAGRVEPDGAVPGKHFYPASAPTGAPQDTGAHAGPAPPSIPMGREASGVIVDEFPEPAPPTSALNALYLKTLQVALMQVQNQLPLTLYLALKTRRLAFAVATALSVLALLTTHFPLVLTSAKLAKVRGAQHQSHPCVIRMKAHRERRASLPMTVGASLTS
jgi:hypothetical protein